MIAVIFFGTKKKNPDEYEEIYTIEQFVIIRVILA